MTPRRVLRVARFLILILTVSALAGCGPDPAKQALLEQLVTTQSAITAGVTHVTLRDREIALRTAAGLRDPARRCDCIVALKGTAQQRRVSCRPDPRSTAHKEIGIIL
jgi:hypothetical protein